MATEKKRIEWIDIGKFICIMFVMLAHLGEGMPKDSMLLRKFYTPFIMEVFFFLAGYVYRQPESFKAHLGKKAKTLLLPWFILSNLDILLTYIISFGKAKNIGSLFVWNLLQIRSCNDGVWFVAALFLAFIPFYFFIKWDSPINACLLSAALSFASVLVKHDFPSHWLPWGVTAFPWHLEYVFQAMMWMVLGYYFKIYGEKYFDKINTVKGRLVLWTCFLVSVYLPTFGGGLILPYIRSIFGVSAVIASCKILKSNKYINFVGANTLTYFAFHGKLCVFIEKALPFVLGGAYAVCTTTNGLVELLLIVLTVVLSFILIVPSIIINKWFPWMVGKRKKTKKPKIG